MEELLNKLIEKGWKPRNVISKNIYIYKVEDKINLSYSEFLEDEWEVMHEDEWYSLRDLVSKWSWLWQYVCENGMIDGTDRWTLNARQKSIYDKYITSEKEFTPRMAWYRLIESALCDEDKLEEFLLDNIKVE